MTIDTVFAIFLMLMCLCCALTFVFAIKGHQPSVLVCSFIVATLLADKVWSTRDAGFLYNLIKSWW